jgi:uncharacterized protein
MTPWVLLASVSRASILERELERHAILIVSLYAVLVFIGLAVDAVLVLRIRRKADTWRRRVARLMWRPWSLREAGLILAGLLLLHLAGIALFSIVARAAEGLREESVAVVFQSVLFHWAGLLLVAASLARRGVSWSSAFGLDPRRCFRRLGQGLVCLLATMPPLLFYTLLYHLALEWSGHDLSLQEVAFTISGENSLWMRVYFVVLAVVIAPVFEELLFRGIALPVLVQRFGLGFSIAVVSVLFACIHGHVPSMVPLFVLSVSLCLAYVWTGSIAVPMVMHGAFNAVTVTLLMNLQ